MSKRYLVNSPYLLGYYLECPICVYQRLGPYLAWIEVLGHGFNSVALNQSNLSIAQEKLRSGLPADPMVQRSLVWKVLMWGPMTHLGCLRFLVHWYDALASWSGKTLNN
jgi:hypothetical protein